MKKWEFRDDMLMHYINGASTKTFQDAENRLNFLEEQIKDVEKLYDAFVEICNYVEMKTEDGCGGCPRYKICFGLSGKDFADTLKRIKKEIKC